MSDLIGLFRVGPDHPWPAWHGDTVRAVGDGTADDERAGSSCSPPGLVEWAEGWTKGKEPPPPPDNSVASPCQEHAWHIRVRGPWSGIIPGDGLIPLDDRAREIVATATCGRSDDA